MRFPFVFLFRGRTREKYAKWQQTGAERQTLDADNKRKAKSARDVRLEPLSFGDALSLHKNDEVIAS